MATSIAYAKFNASLKAEIARLRAAGASAARADALLNVTTEFEHYLFEILERVIYIDPALISESSLPIQAQELALISDEVRRALAMKCTDRCLRGKTYADMVVRIHQILNSDISESLRSRLAEWSRLFSAQSRTSELPKLAANDGGKASPSLLQRKGEPLTLTAEAVAHVARLALLIAAGVDECAVAAVLDDHDARLLVKELFVRHPSEKPQDIRTQLDRMLHSRISVADVREIIAEHQSGRFADQWHLSDGDLQKLCG